MQNLAIISIDPGGTSGIAMNYPIGYGTRTTTTPEEVADLILDFPWDVVVCERFAAQTISKFGLYTVRLCGWIEALCYMTEIKLVYRTPQQRKAYQENAELYLKNEHSKHVIHETEALAHLLSYEASLRAHEGASDAQAGTVQSEQR